MKAIGLSLVAEDAGSHLRRVGQRCEVSRLRRVSPSPSLCRARDSCVNHTQRRVMMSGCFHTWHALVWAVGWFRCTRCGMHAWCPVCVGRGSQAESPPGVLVRYCAKHL